MLGLAFMLTRTLIHGVLLPLLDLITGGRRQLRIVLLVALGAGGAVYVNHLMNTPEARAARIEQAAYVRANGAKGLEYQRTHRRVVRTQP